MDLMKFGYSHGAGQFHHDGNDDGVREEKNGQGDRYLKCKMSQKSKKSSVTFNCNRTYFF